MALLGKLLRYLLSINTIWGLMIVVSFGLCVAQHYLPTTTTIAAERLSEGDNALTIRLIDRQNQGRDFRFTLTRRADSLLLPENTPAAQQDDPYFVSARRIGPAFVVKWASRAHGKYQIALGEQIVAQGRLVKLQSLTDAAFDYAKTAFDIALGLVASMVLFLGLMRIGQDAGLVQLAARLFHPLLRLLFPDVPKDHPASGAILMNWTTSVLGLGNAATPFGLKAMKELQSLNPHPDIATDAQVMMLGYNTAGFALLPTTLIALRKSAGCSDPFEIIGTCMVAGAVSTITAIIMAKLLAKLPVFSTKAALAEHAREQAALAETAGSAGGGSK